MYFFIWLLLLSICIYIFIHIIAYVDNVFFFYGQIIFHSIDIPQTVCSFPVHGQLGCFQLLAIKNNTDINISLHVFVWICFCWIGVAGSYGRCMIRFLRNCQRIFESGCTILHSHKLYLRIPVSPYLHHLVWLTLLIVVQ